jgi:hypothetical protein
VIIWRTMIRMHQDEYALRVREIMAELRRRAAAGKPSATRSQRLIRVLANIGLPSRRDSNAP